MLLVYDVAKSVCLLFCAGFDSKFIAIFVSGIKCQKFQQTFRIDRIFIV